MIPIKSIIAVVSIFILLQNKADCSNSGSQNRNEDSASIPMIASGKRMHNIMRFGKRPAGGESYVEHEKRDGTKAPQHSFLYFGKREDEQSTLPELILHYLQDGSHNASIKRSNGNLHNMMRFGKRSPDDNDGIGYDQFDDYDGYLPNGGDMDEDKRGGHSMLYFGKRGGHNMMYFGKRTTGHKILSFGKRPSGHNMLSFGKRPSGHNMLSFGKRDDDKRAHSMIHFGKREDEGMSEEEKRAGGHAMFHFGKRDEDDEFYPEDIKRAAHSMIHFGKRDYDDGPLPFYWNPAASEKERPSVYRYGKKTGKNNHAMIHFGKRDGDRRAHAMIHFGKRSVDSETSGNVENATDLPASIVTRTKRDLETVDNTEPLVTLIRYANNEDDTAPEEDIDNVMKDPDTTVYYPVNPLPYVVDPLLSISPEYRPLWKKEASKNMFMRFG